jgi:hypothetical protein
MIIMKKFLLLVLTLISIFTLTSCAKLDIPEGDIKDFVSKFNGEEAYMNVHYGKSYIVNTYYDGDYDDGENIILGQHTSLAYFDKRNDMYYHYLETNASGNYVGEEARYNFNNQKTVCYSNADGSNLYVEQITDGVKDEMNYDLDDVITSCKNFFYTEVSGGFHTGGVYYGDYILKNIPKYYKHFSLNEDKTELKYEINISTPTEDGNEILNCHRFVVNQYGLIVSVYTIAYYISNDKVTSTLITEMNCDYVTDFEKINKL